LDFQSFPGDLIARFGFIDRRDHAFSPSPIGGGGVRLRR
jgi:hypothetical protein